MLDMRWSKWEARTDSEDVSRWRMPFPAAACREVEPWAREEEFRDEEARDEEERPRVEEVREGGAARAIAWCWRKRWISEGERPSWVSGIEVMSCHVVCGERALLCWVEEDLIMLEGE